MIKLLKVLVVVMLLLSGVALWLGVSLFQKREMLLGRTQKLERAIAGMAVTVEADVPAAAPRPDLPARDVDSVGEQPLDAPALSAFWDTYQPALEAEASRTVDVWAHRSQLMSYYRIDPATRKPMRDPLTGQKLTDGPGTMQEILDDLLAKSTAQLKRLNDTRGQLRRTRQELASTTDELNTRKRSLRLALGTISARDRAIAGLNNAVGERDRKLGDAAAEALNLKAAVADQKHELSRREEDIRDLEGKVATLKAELAARVVADHPRPVAWTPGRKGTVAAVDEAWSFVVLNLTEDFAAQYAATAGKGAAPPDADLMVTRRADGKDLFVTKVRLCSVDPRQRLAVADVLLDWKQMPLRAGDEVIY